MALHCNLGVDLGADWDSTDTTLKSLAVSQGALTPAFSPQTMTYTLTLPVSGSILLTPTAANRNNRVTVQSAGINYRPQDPIPVAHQQQITIDCAGNTYTITVAIAGSDQDRADNVINLIASLPEIDQLTLDDKKQVQAARLAYDSLTPDQQALVTNLAALTPVPVTGITLDRESLTLTATVTPAEATDQSLTWSSDNETVATLVYSGTSCTVTGLAPGTATVTVTTQDGGYTKQCAVTVNAPAGAPVITPGGGTYDAPQSITVSIEADLTVSQAVYYTTDGSDPTAAASLYYSAPFSLYLRRGPPR